MQRNAKAVAFWGTDAALLDRGQAVQALVVPAVIEGARDLLLGDVRAGHGKVRRHGEGRPARSSRGTRSVSRMPRPKPRPCGRR